MLLMCSAMIDDIVRFLCDHHPIRAVALGGSRCGPYWTPSSDWDLYVYSSERVPLLVREQLAARFATRAEVGNTFFEEGDELLLSDGGVVDLMYRAPSWIEDEMVRVWGWAEAKVGYTTAFVHNVKSSSILYDQEGWYEGLKASVSGPYPQRLKDAIIAKNHPLLRTKISASYYEQIQHALERGDGVSVLHRTTALLASYFDVLFALNELTHPGEKRLVHWALQHCQILPPRFEEEVGAVCTRSDSALLGAVARLLDSLDEIIAPNALD